MSNMRLTVVVRKDLNMTAGLLSAQVAHMGDAFMRKAINERLGEHTKHGLEIPLDPTPDTKTCPDLFTLDELEWIRDPYLTVLAVNCYEDLVDLYKGVQDQKLPCHKWEDVIPSPTFKAEAIKAFVGMSIGPADADAIKMVTNGLELY